jgi:hypothetical protein
MSRNWVNALASLTLLGALTCLGCGQKTSTADPSRTPSEEQLQAEMEAQEGALMGEEKPEAAAKPAEEKPEGEAPAEGEGEGEE